MIKIVKYFIFVVIVLSLSRYLKFDNTSTFNNILTFLSVTTGFTITALSIIATSNFSKELYNLESKDDNSKTLLHNLVDKFESSAYTNTSAIILILLYSFIQPLKTIEFISTNICLNINSLLSGTIWFLTFLSIWSFVDLLRVFTKFVIQSAKRKNT